MIDRLLTVLVEEDASNDLGIEETRGTMNLNEVCHEMNKQGFEYGSFIHKDASFTFIFEKEKIRKGPKPQGNVLWFSHIEQLFEGEFADPEITDKTELTLGWKKYIENAEYNVKLYEKRDLLFAKVDLTKITDRFNIEVKDKYNIDWVTIASQFSGIIVESNMELNWDADTLAVWDPSCIEETRTFHNNGVDWTYTRP